MVSILYRSPVEHAARYQSRAAAEFACEKGIFKRVPRGYVRIQYYWEIRDIKRGKQPAIEALVKVDNEGRIDLSDVTKMWNLESCVPVCSMRWELVPVKDHLLPALTTMMLQQYHPGYIKVLETKTSVSQSTKIKRFARAQFLWGFYFFMALFSSMVSTFCDWLDERTRYRWMLDRIDYEFKLAQYAWSSSEGYRPSHLELIPMYFCIFMTTLVTVLQLIQMYNTAPPLALHDRFMHWARTGSFSL